MNSFTSFVRFTGMIAYVPNTSYDEVMSLMVNPEGHQHDPDEPHLPHHLYLVFDCRELDGCSLLNLPSGFEPYPNPLGRPELEHKVRFKLVGGYDIRFLPGGQEMPRRQLDIEGLSSDEDNLEPPQGGRDFRWTAYLETLQADAGKIKEDLLTFKVGHGVQDLVSGRALLTKDKLSVSRRDPYGDWIFKPKGSDHPHHSQRCANEVLWRVDIPADFLTIRAAAFGGGGPEFVIRPNPFPGRVDVWIVNQPELHEWQEYEHALGVNDPSERPIPYDPHFKGYFSLCEKVFNPVDLPIPHKPDVIISIPPGDEPIICPNPRGTASSVVGTVREVKQRGRL